MAEELARSSGTPEDVIQKVIGQEFLTQCLRKAKFSPELLQDTLDACEINDLNALVLASGLMTVVQASEKLFLMQDEANTVVTVCRKECLRAGVNFGDGAQLSPEELAESDNEEPAAPAPIPTPAPAPAPAPSAPVATPPAVQVPPAPSHAASSRLSPGAHDAKLHKHSSKIGTGLPTPTAATSTPAAAPSPSSAAREAASKLPAASTASAPEPLATRSSVGTPSAEHPDPNFLIKPPVSGSAIPPPPAAGTPSSARSHIPKPTTTTPATPSAAIATPRGPAAKPPTRASPSTSLTSPPTSTGGASMVTPAMNGKHTSSFNGSAAKPPRPSSAPLSARASTTVPLGKDRPSSALATPPVQQAVKLPSYAKPTASAKARLLKEDIDVPSTSAAPPVTFASTTKPLRRMLYMPPRPTSTTPEEKKEPKKPLFDNIRSSLLKPTAAFLAWSSGKTRSSKDTDLRASQTLQADMRSVRAAPSSAPPKGREFSATTVLTPSMTQTPMRQTTTPEPFRLASFERHQKAQEELQRKKEEKARMESHIPKFKASPMPSPALVFKSEPRRAVSAQTDA